MIIFAYGADTFRSRRWLKELKSKFTRDVDPNAHSLSVLDGQTVTLKEINEKINTGSLFVTKRLVVIENIFKNKKSTLFAELTEYLKKLAKSAENIIIFHDEDLNTKEKPLKADAKKLFALLSQQPYSQEFPTLSGLQLTNFIKKEAATYQKEISAPAISLLTEMTGGDLWLVASEIKKLAVYTAEKTITPADVKTLTVGTVNENIFGLTDALSVKDKKRAAALLEEQYAAGLSDEYLLTMLIRQFKILLQMRTALDAKINPADLASKLKLHPFVVKKGAAQAKNFSVAALRSYLNRLIRLDFLNKTGQGDIKTELLTFIAEL